MSLATQLDRRLEALAPQYLDFLKELVRVPSPTGDEGACQQLVADHMRELGLEPQAVYSSNEPPFHPTGREYATRPSWVGHLDGAGSTRVILNAHIDTAPLADPTSWRHPPHAAVVEDGKLYGRGALDDKAGVAMMLLLARIWKENGLPGQLFFQSVIEDEDSGNGTLACTQAGYWCDHAIILDSTWPDRAIDAHLGQLWVRCSIAGWAAPSCAWVRADNPIERGIAFLQAIHVWVDERNAAQPAWLDIDRPFFLSVGEFHSGNWPGASPERAKILMQIGFPPPWTPATVLAELRARASAPIVLEVDALCTPPFSARPNAMAARLARHRPALLTRAVTGHCDLRHLRNRQGGSPDACLYGTGGGANAHVANEYYQVDDFVPVAQTVLGALLGLFEEPV